MQDQAPLGTEAGLAMPDGDGGVDLYATSQCVHVDHEQVVASLGLRPDQVRVPPAGIGGAFGAREDVNLHIHLCLLALHTGRPVKMVYRRSESFTGHVHRHPARMWYRHEADGTGRLVRVEARILLDGGAYASHDSRSWPTPAISRSAPTDASRCRSTGWGTRTNNPPCGAMRGFGAVQSCFGYEAQMDRLAAALGMDPLELTRRNALGTGDPMPTTGQVIDTPLPTIEVIGVLRRCHSRSRLRLPIAVLPGGTGLTTEPHQVRRGVGYALGIKNLGFSEGSDDYAQARVRLTSDGAVVETAADRGGPGPGRLSWPRSPAARSGSHRSTVRSCGHLEDRLCGLDLGVAPDAALRWRHPRGRHPSPPERFSRRHDGDQLDDAGRVAKVTTCWSPMG